MAFDWGEFNKSVETSKKGRRRVNRLVLNADETVSLRFLVNDHEPFIYKRHYASGKIGRYFVCAMPLVEAGKDVGCVGCYMAKTGGKTGPIRQAQPVYAFSIFDPRKYHVIGEGDNKSYEDCTDDKTCKYCKRGLENRVNGVRHWSMSEQVAQQLQKFERDMLGRKCGACGVSSVKNAGFTCPDCEEEIEADDPYTEVRCFNCSEKKVKMVLPVEVLQCKGGCKKPRRATIADAWIEVMRSGEGTKTTYNFGVGEIEEFEPPKDFEVVPVAFKDDPEFQPMGSSEQCALLNVPNPFKGVPGGSRSVSDDDDEDVEPVFKKKKKIGLKLRRTKDDDDDSPPF